MRIYLCVQVCSHLCGAICLCTYVEAGKKCPGLQTIPSRQNLGLTCFSAKLDASKFNALHAATHSEPGLQAAPKYFFVGTGIQTHVSRL